MIPLAGSLFWGPMAITIMGGLLVATILTLLVVPALYALWFRVREDEPAAALAADAGDIRNQDMMAARIAAE
jgi:multidrug efflux pump